MVVRFKKAAIPGVGFGSLFLALSLFAAASVVCGSGPAVAAEPRFEDHSVPVHKGKARAPDLSSHPDARTFRTRLRNAAKGGVNFAGEYVLATWGCGGQCLMGAAIHAKTGRVQFLPGTICCWLEVGEDINPIDYQADSKLIVLTGLLNEQEPMAKHYYELRGGQFHLIRRQVAVAGKPDPGATGGPQAGAPAPTPATTGQFDIRDGFDLPGGDYEQLPGRVTYEDCLGSCQSDQRCQAFTFNTRFSKCFLKGRRENWTAYPNAISGLRARQ